MSFKFNWRFFDVEDLQARCEEAFTESIAATRRPAVIAKPIRATSIDFGSKPPKIAFRSVPAVSLNRTHIVFALKYSGDASLTLETAIQANPLQEPFDDPLFPEWVKPRVVGALGGLVLPFKLKIKNIVLDTLIDVVYTPHGVVVTFQEEPVKSVEVESSLDMIPGVNSMISEMLKFNFMEAFEEDIPESVWASTNPQKQPPQPHFGARRWSQHLNTFTKFSNTIYQPLGPITAADLPAFSTLALNTKTPQFTLPHAIPNRAYLPGAKCKADRSIPREQLELPGLGRYLTEGSNASATTASGTFATSTSGSSFGRKFKPKRRVISLKSKLSTIVSSSGSPNENPSQMEAQKPNGSTNQMANEASKETLSQESHQKGSQSFEYNSKRTPNGTSSPASDRTPNRTSHRTRKLSSTPISGSHRFLVRHVLPELPSYSESNESAIGEEPLLPSSLNWEHHRSFSSPDDIEIARNVAAGVKQRTISLPPSTSTPISRRSSSGQRSAVDDFQRFPGRYASTNDLIEKD